MSRIEETYSLKAEGTEEVANSMGKINNQLNTSISMMDAMENKEINIVRPTIACKLNKLNNLLPYSTRISNGNKSNRA